MKQIVIHPTGPMTPTGRQYVAVCEGKVIADHFCSGDGFAKCDLGMFPPESTMSVSVDFARSERARYTKLFPEGFEVSFSEEYFE